MTLTPRYILYANAVLPGGMTICFKSVTECDADICKNLQVNVAFEVALRSNSLTMARTISMPQIGGLVQRREVTADGLVSRLDNDGLMSAVSRPRPTYFESCSFDDRLLDEAPSTDRCTRGTLVRGGVSLQTVDTCSPQDLRQEWTFRLSFRVVVGGAIAAWNCRYGECGFSKWCSFAKS